MLMALMNPDAKTLSDRPGSTLDNRPNAAEPWLSPPEIHTVEIG